MDAFYASVEQRDHPEYKGKALAVGGFGTRAVVSTASYEARVFGVRSAMSVKMAMKKCPDIIFVQPRFDVYKEVSEQIVEICHDYTDFVEVLSLDEAFLDVTENKLNIKSAVRIAKEIKQRIRKETGLTASAGVASNKFLAKIASDYQKPNGLFVIMPKDAEKFVETLEIERFFGVGKVTAKKMHNLGIHKGIDLKQYPEDRLVFLFGKAGHIYYENARAIDNREVIPHHIRKSVAAENTFESDIPISKQLEEELQQIAQRLWERIEDDKFFGRTLTLKVKFSDFAIRTHSKTLMSPINNLETLWLAAQELLSKVTDPERKKIRLAGLSVHNEKSQVPPECIQFELIFKD